jgi:hypothetical protein
VLEVEFAAESDALLPPSSTPSLTIRLNHRREGWRTFTFNLPTLADAVAAQTQAAASTTAPPVQVDVTRISPRSRP